MAQKRLQFLFVV